MSHPDTSPEVAALPSWRAVFFTHHKCATIWLAEVLSHVCALNGLRFHRSHDGTARPSPHHHVTLLTNAQYEGVTETLDPGARHFHVIRNPMSMLLSAYYSHLTSHPLDGWAALAAQRGVLREHDAQTGILLTLGFLESVHFSTNTPGPLRALQSWDYDDQRMRTLRMEDVTSTPHILFGCLREAAGAVLALPDAALFSFERLTGRRQGEVDASSHFRSGDGEEWRTGLPAAAIGYIRAHYRPLLARFYPEAL